MVAVIGGRFIYSYRSLRAKVRSTDAPQATLSSLLMCVTVGLPAAFLGLNHVRIPIWFVLLSSKNQANLDLMSVIVSLEVHGGRSMAISKVKRRTTVAILTP